MAGRSCGGEGPRRVLPSSAVVTALFWNSYWCCSAIYFGMPPGWHYWPSPSQGETTTANRRSFPAWLRCCPFFALRYYLCIQLPSTSSFTVLQHCLMCCCYGGRALPATSPPHPPVLPHTGVLPSLRRSFFPEWATSHIKNATNVSPVFEAHLELFKIIMTLFRSKVHNLEILKIVDL